MIPSFTDTASYTKITEYLATPLQKAQNLHLHCFKKNHSSNKHILETDITEINSPSSLLIKDRTVQNASVHLTFGCFTAMHNAAILVELPDTHTSYCSVLICSYIFKSIR
jgi:hypothetical protein